MDMGMMGKSMMMPGMDMAAMQRLIDAASACEQACTMCAGSMGHGGHGAVQRDVHDLRGDVQHDDADDAAPGRSRHGQHDGDAAGVHDHVPGVRRRVRDAQGHGDVRDVRRGLPRDGDGVRGDDDLDEVDGPAKA